MTRRDPPAAQPPASLDEIRRLLPELPGPDLAAGTAVLERERKLAKTPGGLGRLEELTAWLATWQGRQPPQVNHPRLALFAANHGVAARGVSAWPLEATEQLVRSIVDGAGAINPLCEQADADLRVYELDLEAPTADVTQGPAMGDEDCARAVAYGMMAVEPGIDLIGLGDVGVGSTTAAAALAAALFGGEAADWIGPGSGVDAAGLERKRVAVTLALAANPSARADPFEALRCLGGFEMAAVVGAILAARMAKVPVLLDGFVTTAAAAVLFKADPRALDHCLVADRGTEPGQARLIERLRQKPVLDLGLRLGQGVGAALALPLLKAAVSCHRGMATAAELGLSRVAPQSAGNSVH
jgi:nicotinate-nucleotide--dimethylbenzimidazole phosphoribosyltransferase